MCGITGMIHWEQDVTKQQVLLRQMQKSLQKRGPDQEGIFLSGHCGMAHTSGSHRRGTRQTANGNNTTWRNLYHCL